MECDDVRSIRIVKDSDYISRRSGFPSNDSRGNPKVFEEKMNVNVFPFLSLYDLFLSHAFTLHGAVVKSAVFLHMWRNPISPLVSLPLFILFNAIVTRLNRNSGILYDLSLRCSCIDASFLQRRMWTIIPKSFYVCVSFSLSLSLINALRVSLFQSFRNTAFFLGYSPSPSHAPFLITVSLCQTDLTNALPMLSLLTFRLTHRLGYHHLHLRDTRTD